MIGSFFIPDGDGFIATELTRGPWSPDHQHGGPPAALLARAVEQVAEGMHVARMTVEFLRPIPLDRFTIALAMLQKGRKVSWVEATLRNASSDLVRARALCIRQAHFDLPPIRTEAPPPPPEKSRPVAFPFFTAPVGYHTAFDLRFAAGGFGTGRTTAWFRMKCDLVAGEKTSSLQRVMAAADSGNGVSTILDFHRWTFVNPDLTVYLHRRPEGKWICLEAMTCPSPNGVGLAESRLYDTNGPIGRSLQSLLIDQRQGI